jgi:hypothetical protein
MWPCQYCGHENPDDNSMICEHCGASRDDDISDSVITEIQKTFSSMTTVSEQIVIID